MVVYTEFPISKCFLIMCLCIAVGYCVAASAAQRDLVARSLQQQEISHDNSLSTDLVNRWYIEHRNISGMMRKVKKVYEDYGITMDDVPLDWRGPLMMDQFANDPLSVTAHAGQNDDFKTRILLGQDVSDYSFTDEASKQDTIRELIEKVTKIYSDYNITEDDVPLAWQGPVTITTLIPYPTADELKGAQMLNVYPEEYVDDGKQHVEFECEASLDKGDSMSWYFMYPIKNDLSQGFVFNYYEKQEDYVENSTLKMWLYNHPAQQLTNLYCYSINITSGKKTFSNKITLDFKTKKGDFVSIYKDNLMSIIPKPAVGDIYYYSDTTTLEIFCTARMSATSMHNSSLIIPHFVVWYQVSDNREKKEVMVMGPYGYFLTMVHLIRLWKPSDNGTQIFCSTEKIKEDGTTVLTWTTPRYTLIYRPDTHDDEGCSAWLAWVAAASAVALTILIGAFGVATTVVAASRTRRSSN